MTTKPPYFHLAILTTLLSAAGLLFFLTEKKIVETNKLLHETGLQAENIDKLAILRDTLPSLNSEAEVYLKTLPASEAEVATFAATLESVARQEGLSITFHFDDFVKPVEITSQKMSGLGIGIDLNGSFESLTAFVSRLSSLPYFFKVDKVTITKNETKPGMKTVLNGFLMMNTEKK